MPTRPFALFVLIGLSVGAVALCACPRPPCSCPRVFPPDAGQLSAPVGIQGRTEVVLVPIPSRTLANQVESPTSADVVVVDPNELPVPANVDPLPELGAGQLSLSFVPRVAGSHHVAVRFDPDFGTVQTEVQIAADRTDAGVVERPMQAECRRFETAGGIDFCLDAVADQLVTIEGGSAVSRVDAWDFARAPSLSGVWVVSDGGADHNWVRLYKLDGGVLSQSYEQEFPWSNMACPTCGGLTDTPQLVTLRARENELLLFDLPQLLELAFDGGALAMNDLAPDASPVPVIFAQWGPFGSVAAWMTGLIGMPEGMACVLPWDGGVCTPVGSTALGADVDVLWSYELATGQLIAFGLPLDGGRPVDLRLPAAAPEQTSQWAGRANDHFYWSVGSDTAVARFVGDEISLEAFSLPLAGATHSGVDPLRIWRWDPDDGGTIRYVER